MFLSGGRLFVSSFKKWVKLGRSDVLQKQLVGSVFLYSELHSWLNFSKLKAFVHCFSKTKLASKSWEQSRIAIHHWQRIIHDYNSSFRFHQLEFSLISPFCFGNDQNLHKRVTCSRFLLLRLKSFFYHAINFQFSDSKNSIFYSFSSVPLLVWDQIRWDIMRICCNNNLLSNKSKA